uniref:Multidrug resistance-associated protein n=1 Tax=Chrysomela lapponica TaxID=153811 RepID=V5TF62_CHRLA|nr:multidrug resistance-associated protein [Chrysomela lapponica]
MDNGYQLKYDNPRDKANFLSKLFFAWMVDLVRKATRTGLEVGDLYKTRESDKSKKLADLLEKNWTKELNRAKLKGTKPSLLRALLKTFSVEYMWWGLLFFIHFVILRSILPLILSYLISLFQETDNDETVDRTKTMYICSGILILVTAISIFFLHHTNKGLTVVGMKARIAVSSLIYRKITKLNQTSLGETAAGQVVNILSNDVNRFDLVVLSLHCLWSLPIQVALLFYLLWKQVQISCLAGILAMMIICIPGQGYVGKMTGVLRFRVAKKTDTRVKLMNEVISGIQVIKMYAWEKSFEKLIKFMRADEITDLTSTSYLRGLLLSCMVFIERLTLFLTVTCYVLLGNVITADKVFSMAQFFNILQYGIAILYPMAVSYGAETLISIKRLQDFLLLEERKTPTIETAKDNGIQLGNVSASWTADTSTLKDITLNLPPGTLCAIVGPVGTGKSSLLQLHLGELPSSSGTVNLAGTISYSSQEPWLFQSSVRKNILFGEPYQSSWYKLVVKVCALEKDFDQFPQRDQTIVGERGVSLSGGQRARINLARAIYRKTDVYLMDDPLSAVDTHVGRHLFDECIYRHLRGKTRILVTHQLQYLKNADVIVVMNEGRIEAQGSFEELCDSDLDFTKLLVSADETKGESKRMSLVEEPKIDNRKRLSVRSIMSTQSEFLELMEYGDTEEIGVDGNASPFKDYCKAPRNVCLLVVVIISLILAQTVCSGADYWSSFWTRQEEIRHSTRAHPVSDSSQVLQFVPLGNQTISLDSNKYTNENRDFSFDTFFDQVILDNRIYKLLKTDYSMGVYGFLIIAAIIFTIGRSVLFCKLTMLASTNLHSDMFHTLLKAPMRFFDTNPSGRVLNRFSKDMGAVDEILPRTLLESIQIMLVMCGILVNIAVANPYMVIAMVVMGVCFYFLSKWYVTTGSNVKHLEGSTKSPVFSHVNSTLNGITTIRAFRAEEILCEEFDDQQDVHTSSWYLTLSCIASFGLWMDIVCLLFLACVTFSFVLMHGTSSANGSLVGLAISQCLILTGMLQHGMRQTSEVINQLTSVERIRQYTKIDTEGPFETPIEKKPLRGWPNRGRLEFRNLVLRYVPEDDPVLKNLTFTVLPGEKVGIVGRTGAGKSSLISALFRLAPTSGSILIDGVDSKVLGLTDLRMKISIIPQEPVLFSATMRYNLDPFDEFNDKSLWDALEQVELKDAVESLDIMVTEGGNNFSLGQRQLICLARAILRNNNILVLDEATANVDQRTDSFIQGTIRKNFKDCTVLTIAHRLNTIMDSDKVLVMHFGEMVEYDHPHNLLQLPEGHFHKMVLETGPAISAQLKDVAAEAYHANSRL